MKIEMAKHSGFCMGVRNAVLKIVNELNTAEEEIYVYGPLIHNPQTINVLKDRGLITVDKIDEIKDKQIAIRTHGIPLNENRQIRSEAKRTINLTCSRVARVQAIIKMYSKDGYFTIIIGDRDHAEVVGLKSYAQAGVCVVSDLNDVGNIPEADKYLIVSQTTHERNQFDELVAAIENKCDNVNVIDTICDSTRLRQDDVKKGIKKGIDTLIVVGGKNSANTTRLAKIGSDRNIKTLHIETDDELDENDFEDSKYVLVTAGASTPGWIINNVLEKLYLIKNQRSNFLIKTAKAYLEFLVRSNIISSLAAFLMVLISQSYAGLQMDYRYGIIASFYIFAMYTVNNYFDRGFLIKSNSYKYNIYKKYGFQLLLAALASFGISLFLCYTIDPWLILILIPYTLGFVYSVPVVKSLVNRTSSPVFKKIYHSKIVTGFGWLIAVMVLPLILSGIKLDVYAALGALFFSFIFLRQLIIDLVAFQGDLILGRETLPTWLGIKRVSLISYALAALAIIGFTAETLLLGKFTSLLLILPVLYYMVLLKRITLSDYYISLRYEFIIDGNYALLLLVFLMI